MLRYRITGGKSGKSSIIEPYKQNVKTKLRAHYKALTELHKEILASKTNTGVQKTKALQIAKLILGHKANTKRIGYTAKDIVQSLTPKKRNSGDLNKGLGKLCRTMAREELARATDKVLTKNKVLKIDAEKIISKLDAMIKDLDNDYFKRVQFIATSILIGKNTKGRVNVKIIDFAHSFVPSNKKNTARDPEPDPEIKLQKQKLRSDSPINFLEGLRNLRNLFIEISSISSCSANTI